MKESNLKLGRISRGVERSLGIALTSSVIVTMEEECLNGLAKDHPDAYLRVLSEIGAILRQPDFVGFDEENERFVYIRFYAKKTQFRLVAVEIIHQKEKGSAAKNWVFQRLWCPSEEEIATLLMAMEFKRISKKSVQEA